MKCSILGQGFSLATELSLSIQDLDLVIWDHLLQPTEANLTERTTKKQMQLNFICHY